MRSGWRGFGVVAALLLAGCASDDNCPVDPVAALSLKFVDGTPMVDTSVNGVDAPMMLDTGSDISVITPALADKAHAYVLSGAGQLLSFGAADAATHGVTAVNNFTVGGLTGTQVQFDVIGPKTNKASPFSNGDFNGTIGTDIMQNYDLDLNFAAKSAAFYETSHCTQAYPPWSGPTTVVSVKFGGVGAIYIPVTLDGHAMTALLDTGSSSSFIPNELFHSAGLDASATGPLQTVKGVAIDNVTIVAQLYRFHRLAIGDVTVQQPILTVMPPHTRDQNGEANYEEYEAKLAAKAAPDTINDPHTNGQDVLFLAGQDITLGADFLATHRVYVSYLTKQVFIQE